MVTSIQFGKAKAPIQGVEKIFTASLIYNHETAEAHINTVIDLLSYTDAERKIVNDFIALLDNKLNS